MDKATITSSLSSSTADDADSKKHLPVPGTSQSQTRSDLPVRPVWMMEDTLLVYSPQGLHASSKVAHQYHDICTPGLDHFVFVIVYL